MPEQMLGRTNLAEMERALQGMQAVSALLSTPDREQVAPAFEILAPKVRAELMKRHRAQQQQAADAAAPPNPQLSQLLDLLSNTCVAARSNPPASRAAQQYAPLRSMLVAVVRRQLTRKLKLKQEQKVADYHARAPSSPLSPRNS